MRCLLSLALLTLTAAVALAQVCPPPPGALLWSDPATWPGGQLPGPDQDVEIPAGRVVFVDVEPPRLGAVTVLGELVFDCAELQFIARRIVVAPGGAFEIGRPGQPNTGHVTVTLTGDEALEERALEVQGGARLDLHGVDHGQPWVHLDETAIRGTKLLRVAPPVPAWAAGSRLVIGSTDYAWEHAEERTLLAVLDGGSTLVLDAPLQYTHWGTFEAGLIDHRAPIALLDRNVVLRGDDLSPFLLTGGHLRASAAGGAAPIVRMDWVRVTRMGWRSELGRYPLHFDQCGSMQGSAVTDCMFDAGYHRSVSLGGTDDLLLAGNVSYGTFGHAFVLDAESEGNQLRRNLGLSTLALTEDLGFSHTYDKPGTFLFRSNANVLVGNVAAGSEGHGFFQDLPPELQGDAQLGLYAAAPVFEGNVAHSNRYFGFFGNEPVVYDPDQPACFVDFHAHHNSRSGVWNRAHGASTWLRLRLSDNATGVYLASGGIMMRDRRSVTYLDRSLFVGESDNVGNPQTAEELAHGRSLPLPAEGIAIPDLVGVELYDGRLEVRDCTFMNYADALIGGKLRHGGALSQVHKDSPWQVDPRNSVENCGFVNARPVYFRDGGLGQLLARDNGVRHTTLWDRDGCIAGQPDSMLFAPNPFLVPRGGASFEPDGNFFVVRGPDPEAFFAQLHVRDGTPGPPFLGAKNPRSLRFKRGFAGVPGGPTTDVTGIGGDFDFVRGFPFNLPVGEEYSIELPAGTQLKEYLVSLRFARPGDFVLLEVKYPGTGPGSIEKNFDAIDSPRSPAVAASSLNELRTTAKDYYYDAATKLLYLKPTLGPSPVDPGSTTRLDGGMVFLTISK